MISVYHIFSFYLDTFRTFLRYLLVAVLRYLSRLWPLCGVASEIQIKNNTAHSTPLPTVNNTAAKTNSTRFISNSADGARTQSSNIHLRAKRRGMCEIDESEHCCNDQNAAAARVTRTNEHRACAPLCHSVTRDLNQHEHNRVNNCVHLWPSGRERSRKISSRTATIENPT